MNQLFVVLLFVCFSLSSCKSDVQTTVGPHKYFIENQLSFFDPYEIVYADGKFQGYTYENWLRKPNNLIMVHETLKKVGYEKLISDYDLTSNPNLLWGYVKRPLNTIIDSLIITYPLDSIQTKYYREFWARRKKENNEEVVFKIIKELSKILLKKESIIFNEQLVNDTLYNLVKISHIHKNPSKKQAITDFEYLKSIGMHGSAYNLLFENYTYQNIDWNKDKLANQLKQDSLKCCPQTWITDDTK